MRVIAVFFFSLALSFSFSVRIIVMPFAQTQRTSRQNAYFRPIDFVCDLFPGLPSHGLFGKRRWRRRKAQNALVTSRECFWYRLTNITARVCPFFISINYMNMAVDKIRRVRRYAIFTDGTCKHCKQAPVVKSISNVVRIFQDDALPWHNNYLLT